MGSLGHFSPICGPQWRNEWWSEYPSALLPFHRSQLSDGANDIRTRGQSVGRDRNVTLQLGPSVHLSVPALCPRCQGQAQALGLGEGRGEEWEVPGALAASGGVVGGSGSCD